MSEAGAQGQGAGNANGAGASGAGQGSGNSSTANIINGAQGANGQNQNQNSNANGGQNSGAQNGAGATGLEWMNGFNDEMKGFISNKGFKNPGELAESYRNLEKLRGAPQDRILTLPEKMYDEKGALTVEGRAVAERLGLPKEAKAFGLDALVPKEGGDPKLMEHFSNVFFEAGIPKAAGEKIVKAWNEYQATIGSANSEAHKQKFTADVNALKTEWGMAHDQNVQVAREGAKNYGISPEQINAISGSLGHAATMKLLHKLGAGTQEAGFVNGQGAGTKLMDPSGAQSRIKELRSDKEFGDKLMRGDVEAKRTWENLHKQAYPGQLAIN